MDSETLTHELGIAMSLMSEGAKLYASIKAQSGKTDDELLAMARALGDANEARLLAHIAGLEHEPTRKV